MSLYQPTTPLFIEEGFFIHLPLVFKLTLVLPFGAKKLPEIAKGLGKGIKEFKKASNDIKEEVQKVTDLDDEDK